MIGPPSGHPIYYDHSPRWPEPPTSPLQTEVSDRIVVHLSRMTVQNAGSKNKTGPRTEEGSHPAEIRVAERGACSVSCSEGGQTQ
jgi:hypothetical protein